MKLWWRTNTKDDTNIRSMLMRRRTKEAGINIYNIEKELFEAEKEYKARK